MNKRQNLLVHVLLNGAERGKLKALVLEVLREDADEFAEVAKEVWLASADNAKEQKSKLETLTNTLGRACEELDVPRLTLKNSYGDWSVIEPLPRNRSRKVSVQSFLEDAAALAKQLPKKQRVELSLTITVLLNG